MTGGHNLSDSLLLTPSLTSFSLSLSLSIIIHIFFLIVLLIFVSLAISLQKEVVFRSRRALYNTRWPQPCQFYPKKLLISDWGLTRTDPSGGQQASSSRCLMKFSRLRAVVSYNKQLFLKQNNGHYIQAFVLEKLSYTVILLCNILLRT